ncbi:hypothetical protein TcCL_Unassigned01562 [Trypanosoma cruzi]|nr:hypothetical protein TcCL_Unassigned01562 [Trypanosoma cruzi]
MKTQRNKKQAQRRKNNNPPDRPGGGPPSRKWTKHNFTSALSWWSSRSIFFLLVAVHIPLPQIICSGHVPAAKHRAAGSRGTVLGTEVREEEGPQKVRANPNSVAVAAVKIDVPRGVPFLGPALTVPCSQRAVRRPLQTSTRACVSPSLPAPFVGCIRDAAIQRRA